MLVCAAGASRVASAGFMLSAGRTTATMRRREVRSRRRLRVLDLLCDYGMARPSRRDPLGSWLV